MNLRDIDYTYGASPSGGFMVIAVAVDGQFRQHLAHAEVTGASLLDAGKADLCNLVADAMRLSTRNAVVAAMSEGRPA